MTKQLLLCGAALISAAANAQPAPSQTAPTEPPAQTAAADGGELDEIVVTGTTARNRTVLESSVAVTVADREEIDRKAPRSLAQALELVPGLYVEPSGGEISNNYSVRGLAGGGQQFVQLAEDGLPVFYGNALADIILKPELSIERLEAVRGGTSGILTVQGAGATVNFITRKPTDEWAASVRATGSSFKTRRLDFFGGGPIADDVLVSLGGFYRAADSVRDVGFTADEGGILRASLTRKFDRGYFRVHAKYVDESNTFLLPIPLQDTRRPRSIPGLSALRGTLISRDNAVQTVRVSPFSGRDFQENNLFDGVDTRSTSVGFDGEYELNDALRFRAKGRYTDFSNDFNSVFNFDNASLVPLTARRDPAAFPEIGALLNRFGQDSVVGFRYVDTGEVIADTAALQALNGNGLVGNSITANNKRDVEEFVVDLSVNWETDRNSLTAGVLYFNTDLRDGNIGASTFVTEIVDNPRRLDIVALDPASGAIRGFLTENSLLNYGSFGEGNNIVDQDSASLYVNNELRVTDSLRIDGGVRVERYELRRKEGISVGGIPVPGAFDRNVASCPALGADGVYRLPDGSTVVDVDNVIANNCIAQFGGGAFTGQFLDEKRDFTKAAWTLGGSWRALDNVALYGRYAQGFQANGENRPTELDFAEVGARYQSSTLSGSLTGFYTNFKDFIFSRQLPGDIRPTEFDGEIEVFGVEYDLQWRPVRWAQLQAVGVWQDSKIKGDEGTDAGSFNNNRPERTPRYTILATTTFFLPDDRGEFYVTWQRIGKRFSDIANSLALPRYDVLNAGFQFNVSERLRVNVSAENLTNEIGLTEGNPRAGFAENPGTSDFYYARPIVGRNVVFSLTADL